MANCKKQSLEAKKQEKINSFAILAGVLSGLINGLFGGGGGMIVVPMLNMLMKLPQKKAHATAILIILPFSIVSSILYAIFGSLNVKVALPVCSGVIVGGIIGALLLSKLTSKWLTIIFSVVMAGAGVKLLIF